MSQTDMGRAEAGYGVLWREPAAVEGASLLRALLRAAWYQVGVPGVLCLSGIVLLDAVN